MLSPTSRDFGMIAYSITPPAIALPIAYGISQRLNARGWCRQAARKLNPANDESRVARGVRRSPPLSSAGRKLTSIDAETSAPAARRYPCASAIARVCIIMNKMMDDANARTLTSPPLPLRKAPILASRLRALLQAEGTPRHNGWPPRPAAPRSRSSAARAGCAPPAPPPNPCRGARGGGRTTRCGCS